MATSPSGRELVDRLESPEPSIALAAVAALRDLAEDVEATQVARARTLGWSWRQIGALLGVSKQAVHKKYARALERRESTTPSDRLGSGAGPVSRSTGRPSEGRRGR